MSDYLWHRVSEKEKKKIEQEAKRLILDFGDSLRKIPKQKESHVSRNNDTREETVVCEPNSEFKKSILKNASKTKGDCIVAEKGGWVK